MSLVVKFVKILLLGTWFSGKFSEKMEGSDTGVNVGDQGLRQ